MIYLTRKAEFSAAHYYHNPDWTPEENALLLIYAKHLLSSNNRSEAVRILIAYFAIQNKFAVVGQVKKSTIIPA